VIGELVDHYRVLELLGCGAMGVVYKALDVNLDRQVAIKVMGAEARNDPNFVERFRQEARLQGALNHPNVALLFDYFVHDGAPVAVMEFIDGESLEQLIRRRGPIPAHEGIPIFKQALRGVAAAHRAGIIHRDLKPSNLMITEDGIVKVMDFGIAKRQGALGATKVSTSTSIGSPLYMAPEQILGRAIDCRTDVYALGVTLYELLSGQKPFNPRGKTEYSVLNAHVNDLPEPPTVHCRDIPGPVVDVVLRSLSKEPDDRFQNADDFMRALPDVPAPGAATSRVGGTVALEYSAPTGGDSLTVRRPSGTMVLEYSPAMSEGTVAPRQPSGTMAFEYAQTTRRDPHGSMAFDYSAATLRQQEPYPPSAPSSTATKARAAAANVASAATTPSPAAQELRAARPDLVQLLSAHRAVIVAMLLATLVLGTLVRHAQRPRATLQGAALTFNNPRLTPQASTPAQTSTSTQPAAAPSPVASSEAEPAAPPSAETPAAATVPPTATTLATTTAPTQPDLSGTWRGEYVDASGRPLLRVVSLSISRVREDGGVEGTLQYEAASGNGECKLHPRRSTYSADEQRLQLSPEGCSPHYPKELGVPLDFDAVNPRANTLKDGRIEAPTGQMIRVKLRRVTGA
jgi:eukaryotic-like serine/threonine-protein kinase